MTPAEKIAQLRALVERLAARADACPFDVAVLIGLLVDATAPPVAPVESGEPSAGEALTDAEIATWLDGWERPYGGADGLTAWQMERVRATLAEVPLLRASAADRPPLHRGHHASCCEHCGAELATEPHTWRECAEYLKGECGAAEQARAAVEADNAALLTANHLCRQGITERTTEAAELRSRLEALEGAVLAAKACCDKASRLNVGGSAYIAANCEASTAIDTAASLAATGRHCPLDEPPPEEP